jgi:hypothetical protein
MDDRTTTERSNLEAYGLVRFLKVLKNEWYYVLAAVLIFGGPAYAIIKGVLT